MVGRDLLPLGNTFLKHVNIDTSTSVTAETSNVYLETRQSTEKNTHGTKEANDDLSYVLAPLSFVVPE
jgi:hypothetical protein